VRIVSPRRELGPGSHSHIKRDDVERSLISSHAESRVGVQLSRIRAYNAAPFSWWIVPAATSGPRRIGSESETKPICGVFRQTLEDY